MRTTLTLEPDVEALLREVVYRSGTSFKHAVNQAIRAGLAPKNASSLSRAAFVFPSYPQGRELVDLTKALSLASELEDLEVLTKMTRPDTAGP